MVKRRRPPPKPAPSAPATAASADEGDAFFATYRAMPPEGQAFMRQLLVVDAFEMWRTCPLAPCRRVQKCRGADIDCFRDRRAELKEKIMATYARWIDIAEITPEEFAAYWEREAMAAGIDLEAEEVEEA